MSEDGIYGVGKPDIETLSELISKEYTSKANAIDSGLCVAIENGLQEVLSHLRQVDTKGKTFLLPNQKKGLPVEVITKNRYESIVLSLVKFNGRPMVDLRVWVDEYKTQDYVPTQRGVCIRVEHYKKLKKFFEASLEAIEEFDFDTLDDLERVGLGIVDTEEPNGA